jgi:hypothetical protein
VACLWSLNASVPKSLRFLHFDAGSATALVIAQKGLRERFIGGVIEQIIKVGFHRIDGRWHRCALELVGCFLVIQPEVLPFPSWASIRLRKTLLSSSMSRSGQLTVRTPSFRRRQTILAMFCFPLLLMNIRLCAADSGAVASRVASMAAS